MRVVLDIHAKYHDSPSKFYSAIGGRRIFHEKIVGECEMLEAFYEWCKGDPPVLKVFYDAACEEIIRRIKWHTYFQPKVNEATKYLGERWEKEYKLRDK